MPYVLGSSSKSKLIGVHPDLVKIVNRAIQLTTQDFTVYEGVRTLERQKQLKASGASKTLDSMHIPATDRSGKTTTVYGHAVDLVPWIGGKPVWDWNGCYKIAYAMDQAATELGLAHILCWGGRWKAYMDSYGGSELEIKKASQAYINAGGFPDGVHFQIYRTT